MFLDRPVELQQLRIRHRLNRQTILNIKKCYYIFQLV